MFNDRYGLTKAVLEGRKTMTRRIEASLTKLPLNDSPLTTLEFIRDADKIRVRRLFRDSHVETIFLLPKYKVGEVMAVAQNYDEVFDEFATIAYFQLKRFSYLIEPTPDNFKAFAGQSEVTLPRTLPGWGNKMFVRASLMPHQIRITSIRVERLQEISEADCLREGIYKKTLCPPGVDYFYHSEPRSKWDVYPSPREAFAGLIDKVSGKGTWERNPWVFVYEFELIK